MHALDRLLEALVRAGRWLVVPLVALLFLQWPLRDIVKGYSREANDIGQIVFALYVGIAVTAASRAGRHLHSDALAHRFSPNLKRALGAGCILLALIPWAGFILHASWPIILSSLKQMEAFPDTSNPGYFVIKLAIGLMALMVLAQGVVSLLRSRA